MSKQSQSIRREQEDRAEALETYLLEHAPGLREHYAAQHSAFSQMEDEAYARLPDPTLDDMAAAEAAEAALPSRKGTRLNCVEALPLWLSTCPARSSANGNASCSRVSEPGTEPIPHL